MARTAPQPGQPDHWASTEILVAGEDVSNVVLTLQHGLTISGRVEFDSEHPPTFDLSGMELEVPMQPADLTPKPPLRTVLTLDAERRFVVTGIVPGVYTMPEGRGIRTPIGPWWFKSITIGGREILDGPLTLKESNEHVVVTFSDRASEITGTVTDTAGQPLPNGFVVVFSTDRAHWFYGSRRVAGIQTSADGRYRFRNLPSGDYFIVAHDDIEAGEWADPMLLARLVPQARRITIDGLDSKTVDLTAPSR
jgi:hypothetical protein